MLCTEFSALKCPVFVVIFLTLLFENHSSALADVSFSPPQGWAEQKLPAGSAAKFMWQPLDASEVGENIVLDFSRCTRACSLKSEVKRASKELIESGRVILNSHSQFSCRGKLSGWTFDVYLDTPQGRFAQTLHITQKKENTFYLWYTWAVNSPLNYNEEATIKSLCV